MELISLSRDDVSAFWSVCLSGYEHVAPSAGFLAFLHLHKTLSPTKLSSRADYNLSKIKLTKSYGLFVTGKSIDQQSGTKNILGSIAGPLRSVL
jgi:hypothetical protein